MVDVHVDTPNAGTKDYVSLNHSGPAHASPNTPNATTHAYPYMKMFTSQCPSINCPFNDDKRITKMTQKNVNQFHRQCHRLPPQKPMAFRRKRIRQIHWRQRKMCCSPRKTPSVVTNGRTNIQDCSLLL